MRENSQRKDPRGRQFIVEAAYAFPRQFLWEAGIPLPVLLYLICALDSRDYSPYRRIKLPQLSSHDLAKWKERRTRNMEDGDSLSPESVGENSSCFNPYTSRALIMGGRVEFDVELRLYMSVVPKPVRPVNSVPPFKYPGVYGPYHNWPSESTLNSLVSFVKRNRKETGRKVGRERE